MPQLEQGNVARVAEHAHSVADALLPYVEQGYDVVALVPSCALMLKFEWPLILPDEAKIKRLANATFDVCGIRRRYREARWPGAGLAAAGGRRRPSHRLPCPRPEHGPEGDRDAEAYPRTRISRVIERCSGHGGAWGVLKENFDVALKVGKPVARQAMKAGKRQIASECPLAGAHILQGIGVCNPANSRPRSAAPHRAIRPGLWVDVEDAYCPPWSAKAGHREFVGD